MDETRDVRQQFIKAAQEALADETMRQHYHPEHLKLVRAWAIGICCRAPLIIASFEKSGSGARWRLACGHVLDAISLEEARDLKAGGGVLSAGVTADGIHHFSTSTHGSPFRKEDDEIAVVKLLCNINKRHLSKFRNDEERSPIDVIALDDNGVEEFFQVTKLQSSPFWKDLRTTSHADIQVTNIEELVKAAIVRKLDYDVSSKGKIVLVIDAMPGLTSKAIASIKTRLKSILTKSGFKEIWVVGGAQLSERLA